MHRVLIPSTCHYCLADTPFSILPNFMSSSYVLIALKPYSAAHVHMAMWLCVCILSAPQHTKSSVLQRERLSFSQQTSAALT